MSATRNAFADALAGTLGSLLSVWAFYPLDLRKTLVQAGRQQQKQQSYEVLFSGLATKSLHCVCSSFVFFWMESILMQFVMRHRKTKPPIFVKLLVNALAAMMNTCVTLPLDVLASKQQTKNADEADNEKMMNAAWKEVSQQRSGASFSEEKKDEMTITNTDEQQQEQKKEQEQLEKVTIQEWLQRYDIRQYWKGVYPSLLLCMNPSIHFTVFDFLKSHLLTMHAQAQDENRTSLSMPEAFVVGLIAKWMATIATYPLIRAKVMLMVTSKQGGSMLKVLQQLHQKQELYRGLQLQLFHTVCKSAFSMMIRERLLRITRRAILSNRESQSS